jgi:hypothetical protein
MHVPRGRYWFGKTDVPVLDERCNLVPALGICRSVSSKVHVHVHAGMWMA